MNAPIQTPPTGALVYASADFDGLELRTMAQACLLLVGHSALALVLNAGDDPHLLMAANMLGIASHKRSVATWARAHAIAKGHTVHVDVTHVRVYDGTP